MENGGGLCHQKKTNNNIRVSMVPLGPHRGCLTLKHTMDKDNTAAQKKKREDERLSLWDWFISGLFRVWVGGGKVLGLSLLALRNSPGLV